MVGRKRRAVCRVSFRGPLRVRFVNVNNVDVDKLTRVLLNRSFIVSNSSSGSDPLARTLRGGKTAVCCKRHTAGVASSMSIIMCATTVRPSGPRFTYTGRGKLPVLAHTRLLKRVVEGCSAPITVSKARKGAAAASVMSRVLLTKSYSPAVDIKNVLPTVNKGVHMNGSRAFIARTYRCAGDFLDFFPGVDVVLGVSTSRLSFFGSVSSVHRSFHHFTRLLPTSNALVVGTSAPGCRSVVQSLPYGIVACNLRRSTSCRTTSVACSGCKRTSFSILHGNIGINDCCLGIPNVRGISGTLTTVTLNRLLNLSRRIVVGKLKDFAKASHHFRCGKRITKIAVMSSCTRRPARVRTALRTTRGCPRGGL